MPARPVAPPQPNWDWEELNARLSGASNQLPRPRPIVEPRLRGKKDPIKKKNYIGCVVKFISDFKAEDIKIEKDSKSTVVDSYGKGVVVEIETKEGTKKVPVPFNKIKILKSKPIGLEPCDFVAPGTSSLDGFQLQYRTGGIWNAIHGSSGTTTSNSFSIGADSDTDRKSTRLNSSHIQKSRMPSSA